MKQVVFIGDYDKTDFLFYVCKLLGMNHTVLLADMTGSGRYRYAYPKLDIDQNVQQYDNFDVTESLDKVAELEGRVDLSSYDYVIIDADNPARVGEVVASDTFYLVTTYENPVMQGNQLLLESLVQSLPEERRPLPMTKVICESNGTFTEDYLVQLYDHLPIYWEESLIYLLEEGNISRKIHNQFSNTLQLKKLSSEYKNVIKSVVESILELDSGQINALWKKAERSK